MIMVFCFYIILLDVVLLSTFYMFMTRKLGGIYEDLRGYEHIL